MSTQKYYGLVTDKGIAKLRAAAQGTAPLMLSHMAFGDGKGGETAPSSAATALVNERYRSPLSDKRRHETNPSILYVEAIIPPGVGGWTLREAGIYDSDGDLIVIAKTPVMDVALLAEGATTEGLVRLPIVFESAKDVQFFIDPTVLLATQAWVIDRIIQRPFITVESVTLAAPPASPADYALYVVPANAIGAWAGKTGQMAHWHGSWQFATAPVAKVVGASDTGKYWRRTATGWVEFAGNDTDVGLLRLATVTEQKAGIVTTAANHPAGTALAIQSGAFSYAAAGGTANALIVALSPAPTALTVGMVVRVKIIATNTGPTTINLNGLGPHAVKRLAGGDLQQGDLPAGGLAELSFDGTAFQLIGSLPSSQRSNISWATAGAYQWTVPDGVYWIFCRVWGGGGGGGGATAADASAAGGNGGGYCEGWYKVTPGQVLNIIVGNGGSAGTAGGSGTGGGTSSVSSYLSATGGGGGGGATADKTGYASATLGAGMGGQLNLKGGGAANSYGAPLIMGSPGGGTYCSSASAPSMYGGISAVSPGGGGGGGARGFNGNSGASGMVVIEY